MFPLVCPSIYRLMSRLWNPKLLSVSDGHLLKNKWTFAVGPSFNPQLVKEEKVLSKERLVCFSPLLISHQWARHPHSQYHSQSTHRVQAQGSERKQEGGRLSWGRGGRKSTRVKMCECGRSLWLRAVRHLCLQCSVFLQQRLPLC